MSVHDGHPVEGKDDHDIKMICQIYIAPLLIHRLIIICLIIAKMPMLEYFMWTQITVITHLNCFMIAKARNSSKFCVTVSLAVQIVSHNRNISS